MNSQWAFVPLFPPASETPPQPTTPTVPQHHTAPPIQSASEIPTTIDFLQNPLPYHYQHRQSRFSVPLPNIEPVPPPTTVPPTNLPSNSGNTSSPPTHQMVTRHQDGTRRPLVRTDGTVRYPLSRALIAQISHSPEEPTCYTQAVRVPEWRQAMASEFNALLKNHT